MVTLSIIIPIHESENMTKLNDTINRAVKKIGMDPNDYSITMIGKFPKDYTCIEKPLYWMTLNHYFDYKVDYIYSEQSLGTSKNQGANNAIEKYNPTILVFIDGHMNFFEKESQNWGKIIVDYLSKNDDTIISPVISVYESPNNPGYGLNVFLKDDGTIDIKWIKPQSKNQIFEVPALCGCFMAMTRKTFNDSMFGFTPYKGREDLEFSLRMWTLGKHFVVNPNLTIGHLFKKSISYDKEKWIEWGASNTLYTFLNFDDIIYTYKMFGSLQIPIQYKPEIWMEVMTPYWWQIKNQIKSKRVRQTKEYFKVFSNA